MFTKLNLNMSGRWECVENDTLFFFTLTPDMNSATDGSGGRFTTNALTMTTGDYRVGRSLEDSSKENLCFYDSPFNLQAHDFVIASTGEMVMDMYGHEFRFTKVA